MPSSLRLMPAMTTSCTQGSPAAMTRARSGPTETKVPVASLKSSAMRPSKAKPSCGWRASTNLSASPLQ
jgi:hypothetical protein